MDISLEQRSQIVRGFAADPPRGRPNRADARSRLRSLCFEVLFLISRHTARKTPASQLCSSPTWWLWRSGCTRSHSELGRETLQRQWYFVSRRGRVGRCQVCQAHKQKHLLKSMQTDTNRQKIKIPTPALNINPIIRGGAARSA